VPASIEQRQIRAVRIRSRFQPHLQDIAEVTAAVLGRAIGAQAKHLYPETRMADIVQWLKDSTRSGRASLDWVEVLMEVEERASCELTDAFAETLERRTFGEYLEHLYAHRLGV
jgi:hypothetical protein